MRDLDAYQDLVFGAEVTAPRYLVEITLNSPMRLSTRESVDAGGVWWEAGELGVVEVSDSRARIRISNHEYQYTAGAVRGAFVRQPVKIYASYGFISDLLPYVAGDYMPLGYVVTPTSIASILLFDGYISETPEIGEWLSIECIRALPKKYPRTKIRAPLANHLPPDGHVVEWGGEVYRIES